MDILLIIILILGVFLLIQLIRIIHSNRKPEPAEIPDTVSEHQNLEHQEMETVQKINV